MQHAHSDIAAIVLAAGRSTRMGAENKLLADIAGKPMVRIVVETAQASLAAPVVVVTGHQAPQVRAVLAGLSVAFIHNPDYAVGLSTSLKAGIRALPETTGGALVLLGDMPCISSAQLDQMIGAYRSQPSDTIIVPTHDGESGNPVLWPAAYFAQMLQLEGDTGAKRLLKEHALQVREVELATDAIFLDADTPDALAKLRAQIEPD